MANELIKLKTGSLSKMDDANGGTSQVAINKGTVYFATDSTTKAGKIWFDAPDGQRIDMTAFSKESAYATVAGNVDGVVAIDNGGTGGTTAAEAKANLGLGNAKVFYGTCDTAAATVAKVVTCSDFKAADLVKGAVILVTFNNTNSGAVGSLTMSVNGTAAKPIKKFYNAAVNNLTAKGELAANQTYMFVYDGTNWVCATLDYNTTYNALSQADASAGTATTGRLITAKVLHDTINEQISTYLPNINAMTFNGSLISNSHIPSAHEAGQVYYIGAAGTYAGKTCEIGDLLVCIADGVSENNDDWAVIQANINNPLFKADNTFTTGGLLIADGTNGKVKTLTIGDGLTSSSTDVSHALPGNIDYSGIHNGSGGNREYIKSITTDKFGHITGITTGAETVTNSDKYVNVTARGTTKAYLLTTSKSPTSSAQQTAALAETGVYLDTTAGKLVASSFAGSGSGLTSLNADNISSGTLNKERLPNSGITPGTYYGMSVDTYGRITGIIEQSYATKTELNGLIAAADALVYKGTLAGANTSPGAFTPAADCGHVYKVSTGGYINGQKVEAGDMFICTADSTVAATSSNYSTVQATWSIVQTNADGIVIGPDSATNGNIPLFDGTTGKLIKNSSYKPSSFATSGHDHDSVYVKKAGDTMTGVLKAYANQYTDDYTTCGINMQNSDIVGLNSIYTADASDNAGEGIHFYRDSTHVDTLWMNGGDILFVPNRKLGTSTTKANSQKVGRFTANPTSGQVVITDGTTGGMKSSGYTIAKSVPSGAVFTDTTYTFDGTYDASSNKAATVSTVTNAINALDGNLNSTTPGAGKTLTAFSQTDGKISATFGNISITKSQITDFPTSLAPTSHTHGNIANGGTMSSTGVALANGDYLLFSDASNSGKIERTSITFDGSTTTKALTQKGTWETFNNYSLPLAANGTRGGIQIGYSTNGKNYAVQLSSEKAYVNVPWTDTDTKQNITLKTTTKGFITAVETTPTSTAAAQPGIADTGVYLTTTAGQINAKTYKVDEAVTLEYNSTTKSLDFIFV